MKDFLQKTHSLSTRKTFKTRKTMLLNDGAELESGRLRIAPASYLKETPS